MTELILQKLREIEKQENVRILYAAESGSRAYGLSHAQSDYDVRFIYVHPRDYYLKLEKTRDVIELPINDMLDINGWDLKKYLQLLHDANPNVFEWIASPVVYRQTPFSDRLSAALPPYFSLRKSLYHYLSMSESNYRDYLTGDMVRVKKYLYMLRPLLAARWVLDRRTYPPLEYRKLLEYPLPPELQPVVEELLDLKINHPETKEVPRIDALNTYLIGLLQELRQVAKTVPQNPDPGWAELNVLFLEALEE